MKRYFLAAAAATFLATQALAAGGTFPAAPATQPFHHVQAWVIDRKQDVTIDFRLAPDGKGHFNARFSNGKRLDGDHMFAKVTLLDADGNVVGMGQHRVGIDATFGGKTRVKHPGRGLDLGPEVAGRVATVIYEVGHFQKVDDHAFWKKVVEIGGKIVGTTTDGFAILPPGAKMKPTAPAVRF